MRILEWGLWLLGALMIAAYVMALGWRENQRHSGLAEFKTLKQQAALLPAPVANLVLTAAAVDPTPPPAPAPRPAVSKDAPIAVLRIGRIELEVAVGPGTTDAILRRGAGWIEGTSVPGGDGNVAISAHRDSHFRRLKELEPGDLIELESLERTQQYRVAQMSVVEPSAVQVLAEVGAPVLTLVTCYPFHFVGNAPQRYVVRAVAVEAPQLNPGESP